MAVVALRKNAWDQASGPQKAVARMLIDQLQLGEPAGGAVGTQEWYVWDDWRITPRFVENMAWVFSHLADFNDAPIRDYPKVDGDGESLGDPLTLAADANLDVAWFTARESLPDGWVADDGEG